MFGLVDKIFSTALAPRVYRFLTVGLLSYVFASSASAASCSDLIRDLLPRIRDSQPISIDYRTPDSMTSERVLFQNPELAQVFEGGVNRESILNAYRMLKANGLFNFKYGQTGLTVAADVSASRGNGMSRMAWGRDNAFVFEGLIALAKLSKRLGEYDLNVRFTREARGVALGLIKQMSTKENLDRLYTNLRNPGRHLDPKLGNESLPGVQFDPENFSDYLVLGEDQKTWVRHPWNNKQFDWFALAALISMRAFEEEVITWQDLTPDMKASLVGLVAMPTRLMFWALHSSDAWEEGAEGLRTSTLMLEVKVVENFLKGIEAPRDPSHFYQRILKELENLSTDTAAFIPNDVQGIVKEVLSPTSLQSALESGYEVILKQLPKGEVPSSFNRDIAQSERYEDAALLHAIPFLPDRLTDQHILKIIEHVQKLVRPAGVARYKGDVYLHPFYWLKRDEVLANIFHRSGETITGKSLNDYGFSPKNPEHLRAVFGDDTEAQWSLHDSLLVLAYSKLLKSTRDPALKAHAKWEMHKHLLRAMGQVTGQNPIAADGHEIPNWKISEAQLVIRIYRDPGGNLLPTPEHLYLPCPHTLWWSVANLALAIEETESLNSDPTPRRPTSSTPVEAVPAQ